MMSTKSCFCFLYFLPVFKGLTKILCYCAPLSLFLYIYVLNATQPILLFRLFFSDALHSQKFFFPEVLLQETGGKDFWCWKNYSVEIH